MTSCMQEMEDGPAVIAVNKIKSTSTEMKATTKCGEAERRNLSTCGVAKEMTPFMEGSATRILSSTETKETM